MDFTASALSEALVRRPNTDEAEQAALERIFPNLSKKGLLHRIASYTSARSKTGNWCIVFFLRYTEDDLETIKLVLQEIFCMCKNHTASLRLQAASISATERQCSVVFKKYQTTTGRPSLNLHFSMGVFWINLGHSQTHSLTRLTGCYEDRMEEWRVI